MTAERATGPDTRRHLVALAEVLDARPMIITTVIRRLNGLIIRVVRVGQTPRPTVDLVVTNVDGDEWFAWCARDETLGATVGLVSDVSGVADVVERDLREQADKAAGVRR